MFRYEHARHLRGPQPLVHSELSDVRQRGRRQDEDFHRDDYQLFGRDVAGQRDRRCDCNEQHHDPADQFILQQLQRDGNFSARHSGPWAECDVHGEVHSQEHRHAGGNSVCQHRRDRADDIEPDGNGSNSKHHRCEPQQPEFRQRANRDDRSHSGSVVELRKLNYEHFFDRRIGNRICVERSKCSDRSRTGSDGCFQCKVLANNHWIADGFIQSQLRCLQFPSDDFGNRYWRCGRWTDSESR